MLQMVLVGMAEVPDLTYDRRHGDSYHGQKGPAPGRSGI